MRVESEAALLGVVFTETGIMTGRPSACETPLTGLSPAPASGDGDLFGQASLHRRCPGGASGHETDKVSPSSPPGVVCLAKGTNVDDGGAELSYYETASGGAVVLGRFDRLAQLDPGGRLRLADHGECAATVR